MDVLRAVLAFACAADGPPNANRRLGDDLHASMRTCCVWAGRGRTNDTGSETNEAANCGGLGPKQEILLLLRNAFDGVGAEFCQLVAERHEFFEGR